MTEFCEAVAYAIYCVGLEGLHNSLKPEEAVIYLYDGRMVELSSQATVGSIIDFPLPVWNQVQTSRPYDHHRGR